MMTPPKRGRKEESSQSILNVGGIAGLEAFHHDKKLSPNKYSQAWDYFWIPIKKP
jgi:hypothetical protein